MDAKAKDLLLDALKAAAGEPQGLPLFAAKGRRGLFASSPAGRRAAEAGKQQGLLATARTERRGKSVVEICSLTDMGLAYLLEQTSPRAVLAEIRDAIQRRGSEIAVLIESARSIQEALDGLQKTTENTLARIVPDSDVASRNGSGTAGLTDQVLTALVEREPAVGDCPLPELFDRVRCRQSSLTIGCFHDALRHLYQAGRIYLHPWTGPLYEIPEPQFVLLVGHELAYYASRRAW
ncbi:MAG: hypothetical protein KatS3mg105_0126 [Gemmatales bacterium]|nr:MAG: hypothetical protein KatS3mg105_0126 [Gemmatales bacterium]